LKVRIDKWLWCVRIFKTRTQATDACRECKVKIGNDTVKPSYSVQIGDVLLVKKGHFNFTYKVLDLIENRVSAPLAIVCYENQTPQEEMLKFDNWFVGKKGGEFREKGLGRPTKRERRTLDKFKDKE
jgi:ribosome-associated heat shock protein Hsp15